jgi:small conductance mechanosensitive channel
MQINPSVSLEIQKVAIFGLILLLTFAIARGIGVLLFKTLRKQSESLARQTRRFATWLIWLLGILIGLDQLGLELTVLFVIVTLAGILIIIALRDILANIASHEAITTYNPFKIGDWIQIGKFFGRVTDITMMTTILMTPDNETVYIPNSEITKSTIINRTAPGGIRISVPVTVDRSLDLSIIEKNLLEVAMQLKEELVPDSEPEVRVTSLRQETVKLALLIRINNPAKGGLIASEVRRLVKEKLDEIQKDT